MTTFVEHLYTSSYSKDHPLYTSLNAKVLGKFKDKCNGMAPLEFVGASFQDAFVVSSEETYEHDCKRHLKILRSKTRDPRNVFTHYKIKHAPLLDF